MDEDDFDFEDRGNRKLSFSKAEDLIDNKEHMSRGDFIRKQLESVNMNSNNSSDMPDLEDDFDLSLEDDLEDLYPNPQSKPRKNIDELFQRLEDGIPKSDKSNESNSTNKPRDLGESKSPKSNINGILDDSELDLIDSLRQRQSTISSNKNIEIDLESDTRPKSSNKSSSKKNNKQKIEDEEIADEYDEFNSDETLDIGLKVNRFKAKSYSEDEIEDNYDEESSVPKNTKKTIIIIIVLSVILISVGDKLATIYKNKSNKESGTSTTEDITRIPTSTPTPKPTNVNELDSYSSLERGFVSSETSLVFKDDITYDDTMDINKFIEIRGGVVIPKFKGTPKNLKKELEVVVSLETYNKFLNGVKLDITYRALIINDKIYVTDLKLKEE